MQPHLTHIGMTAAIVFAFVPPVAAASRPDLSAPVQKAESMVLTVSQAGDGFDQTHSEGFTPAQLAKQNTWSSAQLNAWGYEGGYERLFDRETGRSNDEQVATNAGVYRSTQGAQASLIADGNQCTTGDWQARPSPEHLGNDAVLCTRLGSVAGLDGQLFFVIWRDGRFKGSITLSGIRGHVSAAQTIALARRQEASM